MAQETCDGCSNVAKKSVTGDLESREAENIFLVFQTDSGPDLEVRH